MADSVGLPLSGTLCSMVKGSSVGHALHRMNIFSYLKYCSRL
jgi:hypothetical protein